MSSDSCSGQPKRKWSLTSTTLGWLADRVRRAQQIKSEVEKGTYKPNSEMIAKAIVNEESK
ncbi:MAG: flagellar biosynthesis anti-sigma factor FlgM [Oligoflexia bacterium]|nr:flagellar biosynthesis anti-sigma factor FlgM [Oligoflexia bacterium]